MTLFKQLVLLFILLFLTTSLSPVGENRDFRITTENDFKESIQNNKDLVFTRCLVVPAFDKKTKDINETTDKQALLAKFAYLLSTNQRFKMEDYLNTCDNSLEIHQLFRALYHLSLEQYTLTIDYLGKVESQEYRFLKSLLLADCRYEVMVFEGNIDYQAILSAYQTAMDNASNEQQTVLVKNRIKYIRYH